MSQVSDSQVGTWLPVIQLCRGCGFGYVDGTHVQRTEKTHTGSPGSVLSAREMAAEGLTDDSIVAFEMYECYSCWQP